MFSSRFTWSLHTNWLSRLLESKRATGVEILDLTESNPTQSNFEYDEKEILAALAAPEALRYEPSPRGLLAARQAIAGYYTSVGRRVTPDALHLTASTSEGYAYLFKLLANPGDEVLAPQPSYPLFDFLTALESVQLIHYPLRYHAAQGWRIDIETLAASISTKTRALIIVNPNNPTGSFINHDELAALNSLSQEHDFALIFDEVFSDYGCGHEAQRVATAVGNTAALTFVMGGISKTLGLPQMKLAWIHVSGPAALREEAQERLDFISDTYLSVGAPIQHAAAKLLALRQEMQQQIRARLATNEAFLHAKAGDLPDVDILKREAGWCAILAIAKPFAEEKFTVNLLEHDNVLVHPGYFFDFEREGFLVVSLLTRTEIFQNGINNLAVRLSEL